MSNLIVNKISIVDYENKVANTFDFSPKANLIISKSNGQGKSSLVKSIYYSLGADLKSFPNGWEPEKFIYQLEVIIGEQTYKIKRQNKIISIRGEKESEIFKNMKEYSKWLQDKLGMSLELATKNGEKLSTAYCGALLSPFYIDQDKGWSGSLYKDTFEGLGKYNATVFPKDVIDYYLNLSSGELNIKKSHNEKLKNKNKFLQGKIEQILAVYETYEEQNQVNTGYPIDIKELQVEIEQYLKETSKISERIQNVTKKIEKNKRNLDILKQDKEEISNLLNDTDRRFDEIEYECSYCHSILTREQSLTRLELEDNRIAIISKKEELTIKIKLAEETLQDSQRLVDSLKEKIDLYNKRVKEIRSVTDIESYISQSVLGELNSLRVQEALKKDILDKEMKQVSADIRKLRRILNENTESVQGEFEQLKNELSNLIGSNGLIDRKFRDYKKLTGGGTNLNKDLLALYLIYMNLIAGRTKFKFPFAIDSFVKNETDSDSLLKMFEAINSRFLTLDSQTFFSVIEENLVYLDKSTNQIQIESPLLRKEYYSRVASEIIEFEK